MEDVKSLLELVNSKQILKQNTESQFAKLGYIKIKCDVNAAVFSTLNHWTEQMLEIPLQKKGNLGKWAGKKVSIVTTNILRTGARIEFWIKSI